MHYDASYFNWYSSMGEFGGWANVPKFQPFISKDHDVLDYGCGGGYLLKNLECSSRAGVEINPTAREEARRNGARVFTSVSEVPDLSCDRIISNNALEHVHRPLDELKTLRAKLRSGGLAVFMVPCETIRYAYVPKDINQHLYSWSPMCIGNLLTEAGFQVIESKPFITKWPPHYQRIARLVGRDGFSFICRVYGHFSRQWFQVRAIAQA